MLRFICALVLVLLHSNPEPGATVAVGTYKLVSLQREIDGKADPLPGNPPRGYLIITPKAYVIALPEV